MLAYGRGRWAVSHKGKMITFACKGSANYQGRVFKYILFKINAKASESISEKKAVYRPPTPLPSGKISGEEAAVHRLPKSFGINFDLDFC